MPKPEVLLAGLVLAWALFAPDPAPLLAKGAACPSWAEMQPMLNSERIHSCFGSYGVEVLEQNGRLRISSLYSLESTPEGERRVTRTLAVSEFATDLPDLLQDAYEAIRAGASMGATLQANGWQVDKRLRFLGEIPATDASHCMSGLSGEANQMDLAVQVYDLWAVRDDMEVRFALLAELHDPRYLTLADLRQIVPEPEGRMQYADAVTAGLLQNTAEACAAH